MLTYKSRVSYNVFVSKKEKRGCMSSNVYMFIFLFRCFINLFTDEAVLNIIVQASGFTKFIFMRWTTRNPMSSPIPEHEKADFCYVGINVSSLRQY